MRDGFQKYFVALLPPEPLLGQVHTIKEDVAFRFGSRASLRSPAHITLHMPFEFRLEKEEALCTMLAPVAQAHAPFPMAVRGYGAFPPRVIYLHVEASEPLAALQAEVARTLRQHHVYHPKKVERKPRPFKPHMTVAFRDLKKAVFPEAWAHYQAQQPAHDFTATQLTLLRHTGKEWLAHRQFPLGQETGAPAAT